MSETPPTPLASEETLPDDALQSAEPILRFCQTCGASWDPAGQICRACAYRASQTSPDNLPGTDLRPVINTVIFYGSMLAISIVTLFIMMANGNKFSFNVLAAESVAFSIVVLIWAALFRKDLAQPLLTLGKPQWLLLAPLLAMITFAAASLCVSLLHAALGLPALDYLPPFTDAGYGLPVAVLFVAVQPAIFEEIAFRGLIFHWLSKLLGPFETILVTAAIFAILHLQLVALPHLFFIGVVLAFLRFRSGSLYPGMILHFSHNFFCLLAEYYRIHHGH